MRKLFTIILVLCSGIAFAQPRCGFDEAHAKLLLQDSVFKKKIQASNARWAAMMQSGNNGLQLTTGYGKEYQIPLVVHVIHTGGAVGTTYNPSDAAINSMIDYLNKTYEATYGSYPDTNSGGVRFPAKFVLAKRGPNCTYTNGINRVDGTVLTGYGTYGVRRSSSNGPVDSAVKSLSRWDNADYYNIWIVNKIDSNDGTFGTYTAGYAYFPGAPASVDGTVILATTVAAGNITLPHEIGHAFNLYHTFEGDGTGATCPTNSNCATDGDMICDTEPHKRSPFNCPSDPNPCTGISYSNVQRNFMDYSNCQDRFTVGQRTRWMDALLNERSGLASSIATIDTNSVLPVAAGCTTTITGGNVGNPYGMGPVQVILNDLMSSSGGYNFDDYENYIDRTCTQRANITAGKSYTLSVKTETNPQKVAVYLDTSNNGTFSASELIYSHTGSTSPEVHSTTYTVPTTNIPTCTAIRMRVLADYVSSTLPANGCGTMDYGQAEDFTVVVRPASDTVTMFNAITAGSATTCAGSSVTFTASASKALTSPSYQWYVNSQPVSGATGSTYTRSGLTVGTYYVQCKVKHSAACFTDSAMTNVVVLSVSGTSVTPSVSIASSKGSSICSGDTVTFTATPTNGGTTPTYQWRVNGANVGTNSATYITSTLTNGQVVTVKMTSSDGCASPDSAVSTGITMTVGTSVTASVSIASNKGSAICSGDTVTFTATPTNGGGSPTYQWKVNGSNVGTNSATYITTSLSHGDAVTCEMSSNASCATPVPAASNTINMSVTPGVIPSVSISSDKGSAICSGDTVTFTATPVNGGTPTYQWKVNGSNVGTNSATYTTNTLTNGQTVTCQMTSSAACASPAVVVSSGITMTVNPTVTPSVSISSNKGSSICSGDTVTFSATPTNGGTPTYQWKVNGSNVGTNSATYTTSSLTNGQTVTCQMTSSLTCASPMSATSSGITMSVSGTVVPSVSIASNKGTTICNGDTVTFTATPVNGGGTPAYQWKVNGSNVGTNSATYTTSTLTNGQTVTCEMTSSAACASPSSATSTGITMTINATITPSVSISSNKGASICTGDTVTFTATPTNGGTTPSYQWKVNGSDVGTNSTTYITSSLANGDAVSCEMTSNATCASPATVSSSSINMSVGGSTPAVSIASNTGATVCGGDTVTFTATPADGGATPSYQWRVNGNLAGANSPTFTTTSLSNGDVISCLMHSSSACVSPDSAVSNNISMTVNPKLTPIVAISLSPNDTICAGTSVTFTATYANGGTTPSFQWKLNGANVGGDSATYTTSTLADGDVVSCILTSSEACVTSATDTSNSITMKVNPILTPLVNITVSPNDTICANTFTTFTATTANAGSSPIYQWRRNGVVVGGNSSTYSTNTLANGDNIICILTSSEACVSKMRDTSDTITMTVKPNLVPSVTISVSPDDTICAGTSVTFTATPVNGGASPVYTWRVNGIVVGSNSATLTVSLSVNSSVWVTMASSEQCKTSSLVFSNVIPMRVNPIITPDVTVAVAPNDTICAGTMTTFTATPVNGGTAPVYQWQLNGINTGTNNNTFSSSTLSSGDVVRVIMTSNAPCLTKPADTSSNTTMTVIPNVTPVVVITRVPSDTICEGTNITFSATSANGGASPQYQWQVNDVNVGTNSPAFSSSSLSNGDVVRCIMNSSVTCVTNSADTSNEISVGVKVKSEPDVTIAVSPSDSACAGATVTFTATAVNAGPTPTYQWQVNGGDVGTNSPTFATASLPNGAVVRCIIVTPDTCVTKNVDTSNSITMMIKPMLTPDVTISVSPGDTICDGDMASFTATAVNGGAAPVYQWRVNGVNAGTNNPSFATTLADGDVVDCILTSSEQCLTKPGDTSEGIAITVLLKVTPEVQIVVLPNDTICDGTNVTFVATPVNGGSAPVYQWQVNGVNVGINATSYSSPLLADGDVVRVIMTSSEPCVTKAADTSNTITMKVYPNLTPDVTITVSPDDTICDGTNVTFTAAITNGGTTPAYQWRVNGSNVGTNSNTYSTTALADGDVVDCILTTSETCVTKATDTSNAIIMEVKPYITPDVTISVTPNDTVCDGTSVTFTATPVNGGTAPAYQWQVNGTNVGANSSTYVTTGLVNNDAVRVILTSSEMCLTKAKDTSDVINMTVEPNLTPDITITVSPDDTVCDGTNVVFLANATNGGTSPVYQWKLNGSNVGINSSGYTSNSLVTGDVITCVLTSNHTCLTRTMDTSNAVTMTVNPLTTPAVSISANTGTTVCANGEVTFTAAPSNGGTSQAYQWRLNGADIPGANSTTYMTNSLSTGDIISCRLDITAVCPDPDSAISNSLAMNVVAPSAVIAVSPNDTICDNQSAMFTVTGTNVGNTPVYQWMLNGVDQNGVTGTQFTMNTVGHQDVISIEFVSSDNCINAPAVAGANTITMTVNPTAAPSVGIAANPGTVLTNNDIVWFTSSANTPNVTYQWRKNGVNIPGATGIVYTDLDPQDGDTISLWIKTTDSCRTPDTAISNIVVLSVGVGVKEVLTGELFDNVNLAPNPNNGTFTIQGKLATGRNDEKVMVEVVNAVGAVIYREEVLVRNHELNTRIELGDKAHNGLHMVRITAEGRVHILKFIANR